MNELLLPALRAHMGDWVYYITFMRMTDIAERVNEVGDIHTSDNLRTLIQRQLDQNHSSEIKAFLLNQPQRLFNSLVIGVYGASPDWYELALYENEFLDPDKLPDYIEGAFGVLRLSGQEKLFAIDGQHRVVGIRKAMSESHSVGDEEVSLIFVAHKNDQLGLERTRRLFTRLNRYAKPVSLLAKVALDEDDVVAIITRKLLDEYPLFHDKIATNPKGVAIPSRDTRHFTTVAALYKAMDSYLRGHFFRVGAGKDIKRPKSSDWTSYLNTRPDEVEITALFSVTLDLWNRMAIAFEEINNLSNIPMTVEQNRNTNGGHLLFRPAGLMMAVSAITILLDQGLDLGKAIERISKIPMNIAQHPWLGLIWDEQSKRMMVEGERQKAGLRLLVYLAKGNLDKLKSSPEKLKLEIAGLLNKKPEEIDLDSYS